MEQTRIAVCGDVPLSRAGLVTYLDGQSGFAVLPDGRLHEAQVIVVSAERLTTGVVARLREAAREIGVPVVLLVDELSEAELLLAVECRVVTVLPLRSVTAELLAHSVQVAVTGGGLMPPKLLGDLVRHVRHLRQEPSGPHGLGAAGLTPREIDVLRLLAEGFDTGDIAGKLCYSERTVKKVVSGVTRRFDLRNRPHAVAFALRAGVI